MLRATLLAAVAFSLLGCPAGPDADDGGIADAPVPRDGGDDADRPPGSGGLIFGFTAMPALTDVASGVSIDECRVSWRDIRAIGDAAPGDSRTSLGGASLDYRMGRNPSSIGFPLAPLGLYSRLEARLGDGGGGSGGGGYELRGHVTIGGRSVELEIQDELAGDPISIALDGLRVDGETVVTVVLDLGFLGAIDWSQAPRDGDKIELESGDAFTAQVRAGLVASWHIAP